MNITTRVLKYFPDWFCIKRCWGVHVRVVNVTPQSREIAANKAKCIFLPICCRSDVAEQNNLVEKLLVVHKKKKKDIYKQPGVLGCC